MKTGTKSLLFGVHQFAFHPLTVWLAWSKLYGKCPSFWETVAILLHDIGYVGCSEMDDERGRSHPIAGARLICWLHRKLHRGSLGAMFARVRLHDLVRFHSRFLAAREGEPVSRLFAPDKGSVLFDPKWFYLLRARASGELWEYIRRSKNPDATPEEWFDDYRNTVRTRFFK